MIKKNVLLILLAMFVATPIVSALEIAGQEISQDQLETIPPEYQNKLKQKIDSQSGSSANSLEQQVKPELPRYRTDERILPREGRLKRYPEDERKRYPEDERKRYPEDEGKRYPDDMGGAPIEPKRSVSIIEQQYRKRYQSDLSENLMQFGYDIFNTGVVMPTSLAVPNKDYIIGTGDELLVRVWGSRLDASYSATVNRHGTISLPKIGVLTVAGVKYKDIEGIIQNEASNYIQGININVTFTKLRSLEVYVVGAVKKPGLHIVPPFSTIFDGLMAADGIYKKGSLRKIQLKRSGKLVQVFDLYDLLFKGDRSYDRQLNDKDVIFVPGIGDTVAIAGAVNDEGIFETKGTNSLKDIISLSGGVLPQAFGSRIYLRRFKNYQEFIVKDIETQQPLETWGHIFVQNGDLVDVTFSKTLPKLIYLEGHVWTPDMFQYKNGLKLSDVLTSTDLLKPDAVMKFGLLERYYPETTRFVPMRFPLAQVFSKKYDTDLQPFDRIQILARKDFGIKENFSIDGAVWNPGEYEFSSGITLKDAVAIAGGVKFGARISKVELARQKIENNTIMTEYHLLDMEKDGSLELHSFDSVLVPMLKDATLVKKVTLSGEVAYPGKYTIREGDKLSDVIKRAGGFTSHAYFYGAKYTSKHAKEIQQQSINTMLKQLQLEYVQTASKLTQQAMNEQEAKAAELAKKQVEDLLKRLNDIQAEGRITIYLADLTTFSNSQYDFILKDGDALHIPEKPSFVSIVGSVYTPGSFLYQPNQTVKFYLSKSGGLAKGADEDHVYLMKANGEIVSEGQSKGWGSSFEDTVMMPGDTIIVPQNLDTVPYLKLFASFSDIVFKIMTSVGIIFAI